MKVIIAGSRDYTDKTEFLKIMDYIQTVIEHGQMEPITEIISGHAKGVDQLGEQYAHMHQIPIQTFLPNWDKEGKKQDQYEIEKWQSMPVKILMEH